MALNSTVMKETSYVVPPSVATIADAVWDEAVVEHTTETTFGGKNQKAVPSEMINEYKAIGFAVPGDKMDLVDAPNPITIKAWWDFLTTNITGAIASFGNLFKTNIDAKISSVSGGGSGVVAHMYTVYVEGSPCADVVVIMTLDVEGLIKICSGRTNSLGQVIFYPNVPAGTTVYLWRYKSVVTFSNPDVEVIHE